MRRGAFVLAACGLVMPAIAAAQTQSYLGRNYTAPDTVIRPGAIDGFRNYVTVPDGPCGHPMSVEADCFNACRPCGPLHPICFLHRVGRMLDCLLPCNMCCRGGGCGLFHGCGLGGRTWGHCSVCCGGGGGGYGAGDGCCPHPCGSAFAPICPGTTGGHCYGCSSAVPMLTDPFIDDPLPPRPTAQPATEVRRAPAKIPQSAVSQARPAAPLATPSKPTSPYKIVTDRSSAPIVTRPSNRPGAMSAEAPGNASRKPQSQSILRRASAEQASGEPAPIEVDRSRVVPIIRSQSPDDSDSDVIPRNPLRR
jgi:hypothetical protein